MSSTYRTTLGERIREHRIRRRGQRWSEPPATGCVGNQRGAKSTGQQRILNFHGIGEPLRALEPGEARFWISVGQFRDLVDRIADHPERGRLSITFDDGNISDLSIAAPYLQARGLSAIFFPLPGRLGSHGSLDARDIRELTSAGMGIGSHGINHLDWSSLSVAELRTDLEGSKRALEDICGSTIRQAAIPFGRYNAGVLKMIRYCGYETAFSSDGGTVNPAFFVWPRTSIRHDMSPAVLGAVLSGSLSPFRQLRRLATMTLKRLM